jgi:hypothetical protein
MDAASKGAKAGQGIVVGILPGIDADDVSSALEFARRLLGDIQS